MSAFRNIEKTDFCQCVINDFIDNRDALLGEGKYISIYLEYIDNVRFHVAQFNSFCEAQDYITKLFYDFRFSKDAQSCKLLNYHIEDYTIRVTSISDRVLQLINATFFLGLNEGTVNKDVIMKHWQIKQYPNIRDILKKLEKCLKEYRNYRNQIIHRHSIPSKEIIDLIYTAQLAYGEPYPEIHKTFNSTLVEQKFIKIKKAKYTEFSKTNSEVAKIIYDLFIFLLKVYEQQKANLPRAK